MTSEQVWFMLYCGIVSMQYHPGYTKPDGVGPLNCEDCAMAADIALDEFMRRWGRKPGHTSST